MRTPLSVLSAVLAVLALAALVSGAASWSLQPGAPREVRAVVTAHEEALVQSTVGGRSATRKQVPMTRVVLTYEVDGARRTFSVDRAPAVAAETLPIGATLPAYVNDAGEASLDASAAGALPVVLAAAGLALLVAATLLFSLGRRPPRRST